MCRLLPLLILMLAAGNAGAIDPDARSPGSDKDSYVGDGRGDTREGGESWEDAIIIPGLPYTDEGATCDNRDDITLPCAGSAAPDVVYRTNATVDYVLWIDLCGSSYDTAIALYDQNHVCILCNDDFCDLQSQFVNVVLPAGETYYIVVDGYSTNCGSYVLHLAGISQPASSAEEVALDPGEETMIASWGRLKERYR